MVQSPRVILDSQAKVSELIDHDTRMWKGELISEIFLKDEARMIKSIPLSPFSAEDRLIWHGTKNGIFLVRSAYFLEMDKMASQRGSSSNSRKGIEQKESQQKKHQFLCWNICVKKATSKFLTWQKLKRQKS